MESLQGSKETASGKVAFVANPGLMKQGDAREKNLNQRLDLVPIWADIKNQEQKPEEQLTGQI